MTFLRTLLRLRQQKEAHFELRYVPSEDESIVVGHLDFDGTAWTFKYDDAYKRRVDLRPIEGFDEVERVYTSPVLFPFFAVRIPAVDRQDVQRKLKQAHLRSPETADLLRLFGRRVVSSPAFELVPG
jgi:HipA-like protein